jgi:hypothetical protein
VRLSDYLLDTSILLRDSNFQFTSKANVKRFINQARYQIALQTACIQLVIMGEAPFGGSGNPGIALPGAMTPGADYVNSFSTIAGVEKYPYSFANPYAKAQNTGVKGIIDVIGVSVSWGGIRPTMNWMPWDDLQAYARSYNVGVTSYPFVWSAQGYGERGQVWLFPIPTVGPSYTQSGQGEMEWQVSCVPEPLYTDDDPEAIPEPFQQYVQYYAAYLAMLAGQRYGAAQIHLNYLNDNLGIGAIASDRGKVSSYYYGDY